MTGKSNLKIFIIDDDPIMTRILKEFIFEKFSDSEIITYENGETALAQLKRKPDIIVLDYHLNSVNKAALNGLEVLKKIKEKNPVIPVIFLSSDESPEISADVIRYGAFDYLIKNVTTLYKLEILICNALGKSMIERKLVWQRIFNTVLVILVSILILGLILRNFL